MTLRIRLMLLVFLAMLPALVVILDTTVDHQRYLETDIEQSVLEYARFAELTHETLVNDTQRLLTLLDDMPQTHSLESQTCNKLLKELLFGNLHYANFGVIRPDGDVACSGVHSDTPINLADRPYFQQAMETRRLSVGGYQNGRIVKKPVQVIAQPSLDSRQQVQSVFFASLNLDWLKHALSPASLPSGSVITLLDSKGVILARTPDEGGRWVGTSVDTPDSVWRTLKASEWARKVKRGVGVDGVLRIYALAKLGPATRHHGYVLVGIPFSAVQSEINAQLLPNMAFLGTTLLVMLLLAWFGSEKLILKRTRVLTEAARQMGGGNLSARALINGNDEIARLAHEFNQMGERLQKDHHQINRLSRIHTVLSSINSAILRIRERDALLDEACRIAVERAELKFAWIGLIDDTSGKINKAAWHGDNENYLHALCSPDSCSAMDDQYPCMAAITRGLPVIYNDVESERANHPWLEQAFSYGFYATAAFPLHREGRVIGVMGLYSGEAHFFAHQETELFLELAADISLGLEYIDKDQRIAHMYYHDALTGLPNRALCEDHLQQAIARAAPHNRYVEVIVLNITGFRRVVGVYGNHIADEVLNRLSKHLLAQVREGDTVARLEGDEFGIVLSDMASIEDAIRLARSLVSEIPTSIHCDEHEIHLTMRGGVAIYPGDGENASTILNNAILSCTKEKGAAFHSVNFYSSIIQQDALEREYLEQALRHAIEQGKELELHYQPVVEIASNRIVSLEALSRWHSPELGMVPPSRFIPVAEDSGLIIPLGNWVLTTACEQIEAWRQLGMNEIRVAINVSFHQLREIGFIDHLGETVNAITPHGQHQLAIELTESELMDDIERTIGQLQILKDSNFTIYIDDFGTGYSSLSYLQRLPVQVLKIDQSFVSKLEECDGSVAIVRTIIALAQSLKLKTIAEGVETREQLALLNALGCDYAQGYLFSKPKPAADITRLLEAGGHLQPGT